MSKLELFYDIIKAQKEGIPEGIFSICTANEFVLETALEYAKEKDDYILIESTCNQVNQDGGYTGMTPGDFRDFVYSKAGKVDFPITKIILGGDHLGPNPWRDENPNSAMSKASKLVDEYVAAGYSKLHIDTSMPLADDHKPLAPEMIAQRGIELIKVAEDRYQKIKKANHQVEAPIYVIGTEVPAPGGTQGSADGLAVTSIEDFKKTAAVYKEFLIREGLVDIWERVIAVVVQPGVEFNSYSIEEYDREEARELSKTINKYPNLVFEAHSTDYQKGYKLKQMVEDGFAILKVGPALTFTLREGLYILNHIEQELYDGVYDRQLSNLILIVEEVMKDNPDNWKGYYNGNRRDLKLARKYSLSDRSRYYWSNPVIQKSVELLIKNLGQKEIPLPLISQFMPLQYKKIRNGTLKNEPLALVKDRIKELLEDYRKATIS